MTVTTRSRSCARTKKGRRCLSVAAVAATATLGFVAPAQASTQDERQQTRAREGYAAPVQTEPREARARERYESLAQTERRGPRREGGQLELLLGATACMPGESQCSVDDDGRTWPSFGGGVNLGWRINPYFMIGAGYRYGMFHPDYDFIAARDYDFAHQHGVYALFRPILPIGRVDLALDIGPGYSGQFFERGGNERDFSHGFSFIFGPSIDVFVTDRFFIGAKVDFLLNSHRQVCTKTADRTVCTEPGDDAIAPVHQVIYGLHLGGTFGS
jgi:hypothetical protein